MASSGGQSSSGLPPSAMMAATEGMQHDTTAMATEAGAGGYTAGASSHTAGASCRVVLPVSSAAGAVGAAAHRKAHTRSVSQGGALAG